MTLAVLRKFSSWSSVGMFSGRSFSATVSTWLEEASIAGEPSAKYLDKSGATPFLWIETDEPSIAPFSILKN